MTGRMQPIDHWSNISLLQIICGIADHKSLSAAAKESGVAQSNASRAVRVLERRLGYALLHRSHRGSQLTQEGKLIAEWAREALEALDRLAIGAEALARSESEVLTIGASMTIAEHLLPGWLKTFRARYPEAKTQLRIMNSADVISAVEDGRVGLGFVETPDVPRALHSQPVWTDELIAVVGSAHPWANSATTVSTELLANTPLIEREPGSGTRAFLDFLVGTHRQPPLLELNSNSAICQAVIEGIGPAVLSRLAVESDVREGKLIAIPSGEKKLERQLTAVWKDPSSLTHFAQRFIDIARTGTEHPGTQNTQ
ncbi:LysR family transcriptional regulator [Enteractinococcus helveticum]|uniref:LysR family transcriptional regulator n=1 Tax=Enteractinococcus helveticum TaxID=1837282 RepID=A0A1B7M1J1_9MICC|nr:LysR family transcriptional regulator [Enteractinococcus helveticum]OAV62463.1 LysR family transcriptional regulator [Enteractinococcus helveticum]